MCESIRSLDHQRHCSIVWLVNSTCKGQCPEARGYYIGLRRMLDDPNSRESKWIWSNDVTWTENQTQVTYLILTKRSDPVLCLSSVTKVSRIGLYPGYKTRVYSVITARMANKFVPTDCCRAEPSRRSRFTRKWPFGMKASRIIIVTVSFNRENIASKSSGGPTGMAAGGTRSVNWMTSHVTSRH